MAVLLPPSKFVLTLALCAAAPSRGSESPVVVEYKYGVDLYFEENSSRAVQAGVTMITERVRTAQREVFRVKEWCALIAGYSDSKEGSISQRRALEFERSITAKQLLFSAGFIEADVHTENSESHDPLFASGDPRNRRVEVEFFPCSKQ